MINAFIAMTTNEEIEKMEKETWEMMNKKHLLQNEKPIRKSISDRLKEIGISEVDNPFVMK
ncbi:MAG: hypothetical protein ACRCXT_00770 [Paraclostridium sp.]